MGHFQPCPRAAHGVGLAPPAREAGAACRELGVAGPSSAYARLIVEATGRKPRGGARRFQGGAAWTAEISWARRAAAGQGDPGVLQSTWASRVTQRGGLCSTGKCDVDAAFRFHAQPRLVRTSTWQVRQACIWRKRVVAKSPSSSFLTDRQRLPSARPEAACEGGSQGGQRSAARWREVQALPSGPPAQGQWLPARDLLWPRSRRTFGLGPCAVGIGPWTIVCFLLVMGKAVVTVPSSNVRCGERRPTSGLPS